MAPLRKLLFTSAALLGGLLLLDALAGAGELVAYGALGEDGRPDGLYVEGPGRPTLHPGAHLRGLLYDVSINHLGFRGPELAAAKPANGLRVWCIGGSTTFDIFARDDAATWPARLRDDLAEALPARTVEVVNAGIPGEVLKGGAEDLVRWAATVHPDYVVVYAGPNDMRAIMPRPPGGLRRPVGQGFALTRVLQRVLPHTGSGPGDNDLTRERRATLHEFLESIVRTIRSVDARPVLVTHALRAAPDATGSALRDQLGDAPALLGMTPERTLAAYAAWNGMVREVADEQQLVFADVRGAVPSGPSAEAAWGDPIHFRAPGSAIAAETIGAAIGADVAAKGP
jgi:lysophospholipase L1-like esterase